MYTNAIFKVPLTKLVPKPLNPTLHPELTPYSILIGKFKSFSEPLVFSLDITMLGSCSSKEDENGQYRRRYVSSCLGHSNRYLPEFK